MEPSRANPPPQRVRITHQDAMDPHVDDLIRRQKSLRGEGGIASDRGRKWYYHNWLLFMTVGTVAALAAWAIIEPYFDDQFYVQGTVEAVEASRGMAVPIGGGRTIRAEAPPGLVALTIREETVFLTPDTKDLQADGTRTPLVLPPEKGPLRDDGPGEPLGPAAVMKGQEIGAYVAIGNQTMGLPIVVTVDRSPPPDPPAKARLKLSERLKRHNLAGLLVFSLVAGFIGLAIGAVDGIVCHLPLRALLAGSVGLLVGLLGGFVAQIVAGLVYMPINHWAQQQATGSGSGLTTFGFLAQMMGRTLAWALAGTAMGLGQGIALRSKRLLLYGFIGGIVGGLLGGLLFDPIDLLLLGIEKPSAHWSRLVGFGVIGASVGAMIGIVELLARDVWLRMTEGPLAGKEFLMFKDIMRIGASPRCEIYLFNDPDVAGRHATLRSTGEQCEIAATAPGHAVLVNDLPVDRARLRHGDRIVLGRTAFVFQKRRG